MFTLATSALSSTISPWYPPAPPRESARRDSKAGLLAPRHRRDSRGLRLTSVTATRDVTNHECNQEKTSRRRSRRRRSLRRRVLLPCTRRRRWRRVQRARVADRGDRECVPVAGDETAIRARRVLGGRDAPRDDLRQLRARFRGASHAWLQAPRSADYGQSGTLKVCACSSSSSRRSTAARFTPRGWRIAMCGLMSFGDLPATPFGSSTWTNPSPPEWRVTLEVPSSPCCPGGF